MKRLLFPAIIFSIVFLIYFAVGTNYTFKPKWALDHFNPLAKSLLQFRLDIQDPGTVYDLSYYKGKWYGPWGIIPALLLIPLQIIKGKFIPIFYLSVFFSSLNTVLMYFLLRRIKREFLPQLSAFNICIFLLLFAFGTIQFYVGTLGSVWHVDQITTSFLGTFGIYILFRKERKFIHYLASITCFSLALLGRPTIALLNVLPIALYIYDSFMKRKLTDLQKIRKLLFKEVFLLCMPLFIFLSIFFLYNYVRFDNILEYGFRYIHEAPYLEQLRKQNGPFSIKNVPQNLWYMLFEIPSISLGEKINFNFNLKGDSIFFLTPPLLAIFLASPFIMRGKKITFHPYIGSLWITSIMTLLPSLMHYGSGWMQFGYRYALDINVLLVLLSVFGMNGKINILYLLGTAFSIVIYMVGVNALM